MKQPIRLLLAFTFVVGAALLAGCVVETTVAGCNVDTDCAPDEYCAADGACYLRPVGQLPFYTPGCATGGCVAGATCLTLTNGSTSATDSFCSAACSLDTDCGINAFCVQQVATSAVCFEACGTDTDCTGFDRGWACRTLMDFGTSTSVTACVPDW